ncbi:MAG: TolB family protein [Actinomycetota bacterium]
METKRIEPDLDEWNEQERRQRRRTQRRKVGTFALVASLMAAFAAAYAVTRDPGTPTGIAGRVTSTPNPPSSQLKHAFVDLQTGEITPLPESIAGGYSYRVSPDGTMFASEPGGDPPVAVSVANVDGTGIRQITPDGIDAYAASWSPDGSMLVYQGRDGATFELGNLFVVDVTTEEVRQITDLEPLSKGWWFMWPSFTPDGRTILFHLPRRDVGPSGQVWDLWSVPVAGGEPVLVRRNAGFGTYSPDGRTIAYLSPLSPEDATGARLWLVNVAGGDPRALIEARYGIWWPRWSPDGTRIAYADAGEIYLVDVATGESAMVAEGAVAEWFDDHTLIVGP